MDIRNPRLDDYLDMPERGFTNYLSSRFGNEDLSSSTKDMMISTFCLQVSFHQTRLSCWWKKVDTLFSYFKSTVIILLSWYSSCKFSRGYVVDSETCGYFYLCGSTNFWKNAWSIANSLYKEQKLPNMCLLLNDTDSTKGYGYGYGYGQKVSKTMV
jgi:hypothetical protein